MSPVDPISPVSPITTSSNNTSPTTPRGSDRSFEYPATSELNPSTHLPRLITSFNRSAGICHARKSSMQYELSTPSPLTLNGIRTPQTAFRWSFTRRHTRRGAISGQQASNIISPSSMLNDLSPSSDGGDWLPCRISSPFTDHAKETSGRKDEELEQIDVYMSTPTGRVAVDLPLRTIRTSVSSPSSQASQSYSFATDRATAGSQPRFSSISYQTKSNRSPIHKRRSSKSPTRTKLQRRSQSSHHKTRSVPILVIRSAKQIHLANSIAHLSTPLVPLISVRTGLPHPEFPQSLLQHHLLTHERLDSLAQWYHQTLDAGRERRMYPAPIDEGKAWTFSDTVSEAQRHALMHRESLACFDLALDTKRRRWGRFIGLKGCESPVDEEEVDVIMDETQENQQQQTEDDLIERMEREWREALRRAEEENRVRDKFWRGRF